jgi:hypothetical protein
MCRSNILEKNETKRNGTDAWRESRMKEGRKEEKKILDICIAEVDDKK